VETEARLVDDLLDLTRIARGKLQLHFEVVDAHAVVRDVVATYQGELEAKKLAVTVLLNAQQHNVWADPGRFQQIMLNLMSNAVKFTPSDGSITLRSSNENGAIKIEIIDSGIGIEPDRLSRLFVPFEQGGQPVARKLGGLGLGLSIVRSLVQMHKGSISAASSGVGKGTTMMLRLDTVPPGKKSHESEADNPSKEPEYRVLLVEDHTDTREVMRKLLTNLGCSVTTAGSVREAMEAAEQNSFDLLVSDIGLPDGSGVDIMRQLSQRDRVKKGIALTGFGQDEDLRRSREAGFDSHLTKPVNFQTLHEAIDRASRSR
jgi:CheY-like chemotaxis protein